MFCSTNLNHIDRLLIKPFSSLSFEDKIKVKRYGPHQPFDVHIVTIEKDRTRTFQTSWFEKVPWLTVSMERKSLYCFYCILFGGDLVWSQTGFRDLKHLSESLKKHELSARHLKSAIDYKMFNTVNIKVEIDSPSVETINKNNEIIKQNRYIINKIIDILKFCAGNNFDLRNHNNTLIPDNRDIFREMIIYTMTLDRSFDEYLKKTLVGHTSKAIQKEILDCIKEVYLNSIENEIKQTRFISIQVDEIPGVADSTELAITLRYIHENHPVERFLGFYDIDDRSATDLKCTIDKAIKKFNLNDRLIAQTYDGAGVISGVTGGVQDLIKENYTFAHFVHCYAHQLQEVIKVACSGIKEVRIFFSNVSGFASFFSETSNRNNFLAEVCRKNGFRRARFNFNTRTVETIFENEENLKNCLNLFQVEKFNDDTTRQAFSLYKLLSDEDFLYFVHLFYSIFKNIDTFYHELLTKNSTELVLSNHIQTFTNIINDIANKGTEVVCDEMDSKSTKRARIIRPSLNDVAKEACNIVINQIKTRFEKFELINAFNILNPREFSKYHAAFPTDNLTLICDSYPFLSNETLKSELTILFDNKHFKLNSITAVYKFLKSNTLDGIFRETTRLCEIVLTTPAPTREPERIFNTLKNIKMYKLSRIGQDPLNLLAILSIEKNYVSKIENLNEKVMELFSSQSHRRAAYKIK